MSDKFLNETGLAQVASNVNTRLKTVTEMPATANDGAVRLYVGETSGSYSKGHTYQAKIENAYCYSWYNESAGASMYFYVKELVSNTSLYMKDSTAGIAENISQLQLVGPEGTIEDFDNLTAGEVTESVLQVKAWDGETYNTFDASRVSEHDLNGMNWVDITPAGGAVSADDVSYANAQVPSAANVGDALDTIIGKIYYVNPEVTSFTMAPSTTEYEIGSTVNELVFNWTYNKDIVSQTLTDCTLADETVRTATYSTPITSNKTFTLTASDGENTATASKSISFKHKVYWGAASEPAEFTSAFILALTGKKFATNFKGTYNMTLGEGQYGYVAYPSSWGTISSWWIGGFEVETHDCGTISFTNASGNTTTFRITRTTRPSLGSISAEVK